MKLIKILTFTTLFFNSLSKCFNLAGNTYKASIRVPIIRSSQNIRLKFLTKENANLQFSGFIKASGNIYYKMHERDDNIEFIADKSIEKITNKFKLILENASYDEVTDTAKIYIRSKFLLIKQEINFYRDYSLN
tara:strand:+ start:2137 stop:2538 length:402 start_codon:yes stop_codon:yes gene_type:complete